MHECSMVPFPFKLADDVLDKGLSLGLLVASGLGSLMGWRAANPRRALAGLPGRVGHWLSLPVSACCDQIVTCLASCIFGLIPQSHAC